MKKVLCIFLASLMLLGCLAFTAAADDKPGDYDSDLLAIWDFENENSPNADAINGALLYRTDGITNKTDNPAAITISNGVAKVSNVGEILYLQYSQRVKAKYEGHENKTLYAKFYVDGTAVNNDTGIFWHRSSDFSVSMKSGTTGEQYAFTCKFFGTTFDIPAEYTPTKPENGWYYAAVSIGTYDEENTVVPVTISLSANGIDYLCYARNITIASENKDTMLNPQKQGGAYSYLTFGKAAVTYKSGSNAKSTGLDVYFDEIALFSRVLSAHELALMNLECSDPSSDIALVGYQKTTPAEGLFNVRVVGTINNIENYKSVGFTAVFSNTAGTTETLKVSSTTVYSSLNATDASGNTYVAVTAAEESAEALFALCVEDIPTTGSYTITIIGTAVNALDETVNTVAATYSLVDGVLSPAA